MAVIGRQTINGIEIVNMNADPSLTSTAALTGSLGYFTTDGTWFRKYGSGGTDWNMFIGKSATISTTDATTTTIDTIAIPLNTTCMIEVDGWGRRTGGSAGSPGDSAVYKTQTRYKNIAGVVTRHNENAAYTSEDNTAWDISTAVSGTNCIVTVKGSANNNINWRTLTKRTFING